jgi:hypothetical protein
MKAYVMRNPPFHLGGTIIVRCGGLPMFINYVNDPEDNLFICDLKPEFQGISNLNQSRTSLVGDSAKDLDVVRNTIIRQEIRTRAEKKAQFHKIEGSVHTNAIVAHADTRL